MIRKISFLIVPLFFLIFVSGVNAQTPIGTASAGTTAAAREKLKQQMELIMKPQEKATPSGIGSNLRIAIQAQRQKFKADLLNIKDQRKKTLVEDIDSGITEANSRLTKRYSDALTSLQGFLDKIKQSTTDANTLGDIATAQTTINTAKEAVISQAAKTYTMEIADDATLRTNAGTTVSEFRHDMLTVYQLVVDAKQTVQNLNIQRKLIKTEATSSANL